MTENGSMEMDVLQAFIAHDSKHFQRIVGNESVLLTLDGHASRNGTGWIEECQRNNIEAVIAPANTSHFLQPCDQMVNKRFKSAMRELRDAFVSQSDVDTRKVSFNLASAVHAYEQITALEITKSFACTGLFPFQHNFAQRFAKNIDGLRDDARCKAEALQRAGVASRLRTVMKRKSDKETFAKLREAFSKSSAPSTAIQTISCILRNTETVNSIVLSTKRSRSSGTVASTNLPMVLHAPGAAAECVTLRETLAKKREEEELKIRELAAKAQRKQDALEAKKAEKERARVAKRLLQQQKAKHNKRLKLESKKKATFENELVTQLTEAALDCYLRTITPTAVTRSDEVIRTKKRSVRAARFTAGLVVELLVKETEQNE